MRLAGRPVAQPPSHARCSPWNHRWGDWNPSTGRRIPRISNFDGATPQKPARYARVWGTVRGTIQVQTFNPVSPNALRRVRTFRAVNAKTQVSHTFTVGGTGSMNINAPVYPNSVTTFVIRTGKPGHYSWRCWNPCGSGPQGWTEAMSQKRNLTGTITVA